MRSEFNLSASAPRLDIDNRISLRYYYRIAHALIKQADIFREEKNIIDLYVMLLRFSSLITETLPFHQDYQKSLQNEKLFFRKKLLNVLDELEALKPDVQRRIEELNWKPRNQVSRLGQAHQNSFVNNSLEWPLTKKQTSRNEIRQIYRIPGQDNFSRVPINQRYKLPQSKLVEEQFHKLSLSIPRPKEETLSRHSILGPNGLHGQWQPPFPNRGIQYPSNLDLIPVDIPRYVILTNISGEMVTYRDSSLKGSVLVFRPPRAATTFWQSCLPLEPECRRRFQEMTLAIAGHLTFVLFIEEEFDNFMLSGFLHDNVASVLYRIVLAYSIICIEGVLHSVFIGSSLLQPTEDGSAPVKDGGAPEHEKSPLEEVLSLHDGRVSEPTEELCSLITFDVTETTPKMDIIREPSPPPVRAEVQDLAVITSEVSHSISGQTTSFQDEIVGTESPLQVHISTVLMDSFMRVAKSHTDRNLETCGVLAGSLKNRKFYVTALIIPKQESTSDSCQTTNEEEIFDYQDKQSLFTLGWIHTHPTQSCFMSSIDVHTHYSYQIMLPEAIAIVMAPRDSTSTHGIFRLTAPGGMSVIRKCEHRGFHPHPEPSGGGPIYERCADVYMNSKIKFDVVDLR